MSIFIFIFIILLLLLSSIIAEGVEVAVNYPIISFCGGIGQSCAVFNSNQMKCFGNKFSLGQSTISEKPWDLLGDTPSELGDALVPINVGQNLYVDRVSCGGGHICVRLLSGDLKCFGNNGNGQIGLETITNPIGEINGYIGDNLPIISIGTGLKVLDIALGYGHSCILVTGGRVKCYGRNIMGELGYEDTTYRGHLKNQMGDNLKFVYFGINSVVDSIYSGPLSGHNCVILSSPATSSQRIKCWGKNVSYLLGYGNIFTDDARGDEPNEMGDHLPLVDLGIESRVQHLALGSDHTCALLVNNAMKCWGYAWHGALGSGSSDTLPLTGDSLPIVSIDSQKTINLISAGSAHTCIVYDDMTTMKCVGRNDYGQLGQSKVKYLGRTKTTTLPFIPAIQLGTGTLKINSIYSGSNYNCVVFEDYSLKCFGNNEYGQLAIGSNKNVGRNQNQMGKNLKFSVLFSPIVLCEYSNAKQCNADNKCIWKKVQGKQTCTIFNCSDLNKVDCDKETARCLWNVDSNSCYTKNS